MSGTATSRRARIARVVLLPLIVGALMARGPTPSASAYTPIYFPPTGLRLGAHFKLVWEQNGGLPTFGYPLSEEFQEGDRPTQYFERAVLTYFPEHANTPFEVQLVQLGRQALTGQGPLAAREVVAPFAPTDSGYFFPETGDAVRFAFLRQ